MNTLASKLYDQETRGGNISSGVRDGAGWLPWSPTASARCTTGTLTGALYSAGTTTGIEALGAITPSRMGRLLPRPGARAAARAADRIDKVER